MRRARAAVVWCLPLAAVLVSACGTQYQSERVDRRYEDLRNLVLEQRRAIEDLRREQESLRASVDELQYGRNTAGRPVHGPGGAGGDSFWGGGRMGGSTETPPVVGAEGDARFAPSGGSMASVGTPRSGETEPEAQMQPAPVGGAVGEVPAEMAGTNYDSGMRALGAGDYDEAIQHFRNFLHDNASSKLADDAQYWIGEAYFRKGQYHRAIIELNQVSIAYGSGDRAPAALVRQAEAFRIVGDRVDAKLSLQKVINRYPGTSEAAKASKMLSEIGG